MGVLNTWLREKLMTTAVAAPLPVVIQVDKPENVPSVQQALASFFPSQRPFSVFNFIRIVAPVSMLQQIAGLQEVTRISYDTPMYIRGAPSITDPLLGRIELASAVVPVSPREAFSRAILSAPLTVGALSQVFSIRGMSGGPKQSGIIMIPTGETREWVEAPDDNKINTKVAVIDTGIAYPHPLLHPSKGLVRVFSTTGEPGNPDGLGHGTWCVTAAFGDSFNTRFGLCRGIADPENGNLISVKALSNIGFGTTWGIIQAIDIAVREGAKVISMSLGGELQGSVLEDPQCVLIDQLRDSVIFVVAAGNSGPAGWEVGSPGAAAGAVTVGAWSTHYNGLATFSSRGPSGKWYRDHQEEWERDLEIFGLSLIKPDCVAPGGGPVNPGDPMDLIYSGVVGWMDGLYDLTPGDGFDGMRGTSMATPHAAGIISIAYDRDMVQTASDVRTKLFNTMPGEGDIPKSPEWGYGLITLGRLASQ